MDWHAEDHEQTMLVLGLSSKREVTRTRIRVRTMMAAQTRAIFGVAVEDRTEIPCSRRSPHSLVSASVVAVHYVVARDLAVRVSRQRSR